MDEQVQAQLPAEWRDHQIAKLPPEVAQRYYDARDEEIKEIKKSLRNKRRPDYYGLAEDDEYFEGGVDDIF